MTTTQRFVAVLGFGLAVAPIASLGAQDALHRGTTTQEQQATFIASAGQVTKERADKLLDPLKTRHAISELFYKTFVTPLAERMTDMKEIKDGSLENEKLFDDLKEKAVNIIPVDKMLSDEAGDYQEGLSREYADAAIAFYGSSAGQHMLAVKYKAVPKLTPLARQHTDEQMKDLTSNTNLRTGDISRCG